MINTIKNLFKQGEWMEWDCYMDRVNDIEHWNFISMITKLNFKNSIKGGN